ncbi:hypothetical protein HMPREF1042_2168 [Streptococcus constellatus subsp. pharyngis SK1060 = CCUG 46377]|uniref:Uncharacterized protein n=1 Tax=Streptococcus constellatus subsp. pharyngis SK1060 = CCUG 46377 TaxID=1035184 RepID=F9PAB2_STRCV|nr:hypothetical protein HMPREF1042_2168 [Streptococcus constellatus subsp. pharyngis SK1060 = CCUG 46377]
MILSNTSKPRKLRQQELSGFSLYKLKYGKNLNLVDKKPQAKTCGNG